MVQKELCVIVAAYWKIRAFNISVPFFLKKIMYFILFALHLQQLYHFAMKIGLVYDIRMMKNATDWNLSGTVLVLKLN